MSEAILKQYPDLQEALQKYLELQQEIGEILEDTDLIYAYTDFRKAIAEAHSQTEEERKKVADLMASYKLAEIQYRNATTGVFVTLKQMPMPVYKAARVGVEELKENIQEKIVTLQNLIDTLEGVDKEKAQRECEELKTFLRILQRTANEIVDDKRSQTKPDLVHTTSDDYMNDLRKLKESQENNQLRWSALTTIYNSMVAYIYKTRELTKGLQKLQAELEENQGD